MARLHVEIVPALSDNYVYLLHDPESGVSAVVDPGDAAPVIAALDRRTRGLNLILNTHHHGDHTGGNLALKTRYGATVVGPRAEAARIPGLDRAVGEGDAVPVGGRFAVVLDTPGHTTGGISFWFEDSDALFCGDTLFALGCGRLLEGTAPQMWASLLKLRALPDHARVYCGHEYTQSNARFARSVDPGNASLEAYAEEIDEARAAKAPTIPAQLGREKLTNPFLRADQTDLQAALGMSGAEPASVFAAIRTRKDGFRG